MKGQSLRPRSSGYTNPQSELGCGWLVGFLFGFLFLSFSYFLFFFSSDFYFLLLLERKLQGGADLKGLERDCDQGARCKTPRESIKEMLWGVQKIK